MNPEGGTKPKLYDTVTFFCPDCKEVLGVLFNNDVVCGCTPGKHWEFPAPRLKTIPLMEVNGKEHVSRSIEPDYMRRSDYLQSDWETQDESVSRKTLDMDEQELRAAEKIRGAIMTLPLRYARTIKLLNDALKHMSMVGEGPAPPRPPAPLSRILREADTKEKCRKCGSSQKWGGWWWKNSRGCIQPKCLNYYNRGDKKYFDLL